MTWLCLCPRDVPDTIAVCAVCGLDRPATTVSVASRCDVCHTPTRPSQLTMAAADPRPGHDDDDHKLSRCASCHFAYIKRRAQLDPISPEDLAKCKAKLAESFARAADKWTTTRL